MAALFNPKLGFPSDVTIISCITSYMVARTYRDGCQRLRLRETTCLCYFYKMTQFRSCIVLAFIASLTLVDQTAADFQKCGIDEYFQRGKIELNPPVSGILTHSVTYAAGISYSFSLHGTFDSLGNHQCAKHRFVHLLKCFNLYIRYTNI